MASTPYFPQDTDAVSQMLIALERARGEKRGPVTIRKTTFKLRALSDELMTDSWKMQDWDYKKPDLPTYARGLFTIPGSSYRRPEIAVRGYDKFFNVNEVPETTWESIASRTKPPYELTLKENGCIIFLAGLEDGTLLVCSKHSTGGRDDIQMSHASAGEHRIEKQLATVGKTKSDLARELHSRNATAVAELCDDEFEEHVLAYKTEESGLYLHGININIPDFVTYPSSIVQEFAEDWGFLKTGLIVMDDVHEVRSFLETVARSGSYEGREVEGFVIRCKMSTRPKTQPFQDWFFKYKFEEPYLMYRQWRECTKSVIAGKSPRIKKHRKITEEYIAFARKRLAADPELGRLFNQNHGIISLRDAFLRSKGLKGYDAASLDGPDDIIFRDVVRDVVLCPIATIGCGKTTIAQALVQLFDWGHVQNDNISGKGRPPRFVKAILDSLQRQPVVFADRNNATETERKQIIHDLRLQHKLAKLVCLNFRHAKDALDEIREITRARVLARGDNHQTIHAASDQAKFFGVMEGFISRFQPCAPESFPDDGFDLIIDLDARADSRRNLEAAVASLQRHFPTLVPLTPTAEQYDKAMKVALGYKPSPNDKILDRPTDGNAKKARLEYMSIDVAKESINNILRKTFNDESAEMSCFYLQLKQTGRIQTNYHVTLMHRASSATRRDLWQKYVQIWEASGCSDARLDSCSLMLERACFLLNTGLCRLISNANL